MHCGTSDLLLIMSTQFFLNHSNYVHVFTRYHADLTRYLLLVGELNASQLLPLLASSEVKVFVYYRSISST